MQIGDIVRYGGGPSALMQIEYISVGHGSTYEIGKGYVPDDRFYGLQCMGGTQGAYANNCIPANAEDLKIWESCASSGKWIRRAFNPNAGRGLVGQVED